MPTAFSVWDGLVESVATGEAARPGGRALRSSSAVARWRGRRRSIRPRARSPWRRRSGSPVIELAAIRPWAQPTQAVGQKRIEKASSGSSGGSDVQNDLRPRRQFRLLESAIASPSTSGKAFQSKMVGCHVYAAKMHDYRFKQMEYTLPEEYSRDRTRPPAEDPRQPDHDGPEAHLRRLPRADAAALRRGRASSSSRA